MLPVAGPALFYSCEEDEDEICRRLEPIATHYRSSRGELRDKGLHVISCVGDDAIS